MSSWGRQVNTVEHQEIAIKLDQVYKKYDSVTSRQDQDYVLKGISLTVKENEFVCILGKSGCGKSTFINLIAGYLKPDKGSILVHGEEVKGPSAKCGVVFQEHALFPWYTVEKNIAFGLKIRKKSKEEIREAVGKYIKMIGLEGYEKSYPMSLSGGMAQRVGIARALANEPEVLLMDEPFGALDAITRDKMRAELTGIWKATKKTIVFITHSVSEAVCLANKVVLFKNGIVAEEVEIDLPYPRDIKASRFLEYVSFFEQGLCDREEGQKPVITE